MDGGSTQREALLLVLVALVLASIVLAMAWFYRPSSAKPSTRGETRQQICPEDTLTGTTHAREATQLPYCLNLGEKNTALPSQLSFTINQDKGIAQLQFQPTTDVTLLKRIVAYRFRVYQDRGAGNTVPCSEARQIDIDRSHTTQEFNERIELDQTTACRSQGIYFVQVNSIVSREGQSPLGKEVAENSCSCADFVRDYYYVGAPTPPF